MKEKILTVSTKDLKMDKFRAGGKGGQKQNKTETGIRFRHEPSGAVGESREFTTQIQNKRAAFKRLAESAEMQAWIRKQVAEISLSKAERLAVEQQILKTVDKMVSEENLVIEVHDEDGEWVEVEDL